MMRRLVCQEEHGDGGEAGKMCFSEKGNRSLPWSDEEEDWETWGSGALEEMERPEGSKDWDQEEQRSRDGQESRRIGEDRDRKDRDGKGQCAKLGVVMKRFFLGVFSCV